MKDFLEGLNKCTTTINKIAEYITGAFFFGMIFCASSQVIFRFVFKISTPWAEELARYFFIWTTLLGASCATKLYKHIRVDILVSKLKGKSKIIAIVASSFVLIGFYLVCIRSGYGYVMKGNTQISAVTSINMGLVYASLPISFTLMLIYEIEIILNTIFGSAPNFEDVDMIGGSE